MSELCFVISTLHSHFVCKDFIASLATDNYVCVMITS